MGLPISILESANSNRQTTIARRILKQDAFILVHICFVRERPTTEFERGTQSPALIMSALGGEITTTELATIQLSEATTAVGFNFQLAKSFSETRGSHSSANKTTAFRSLA